MAEEQNGKWVTLENGVHLFIKKGQTLDDAVEQNISKEKRQEQEDYDNLSAREYGQKYAKTEKEAIKSSEDKLKAQNKQKDPKRYDSEEYSQLEMYDHVEEDLGLDWHEVKQIYFLEDTFKENPKNAVVELENGNYIEYNVETGKRKDIKGEDWIEPWNR